MARPVFRLGKFVLAGLVFGGVGALSASPSLAQEIGSAQPSEVVVCVSNGTAASVAPCLNDTAGLGYSPSIANATLTSSTDYGALFPSGAFSAEEASEYFMTGMALVLMSYYVSLPVGMIIKTVKSVL